MAFIIMSICHNLPTKPQPFEKNSIHYSVTTKSNLLLNLTCACSLIRFVVCVFTFSRAVTLAILTCATAPKFQRYQTLESSSKNLFTNFHIRHSSFTIIIPSNVLCTKPNFQFCRFLSLSMTKTSSPTTYGLDVFH